MTLGLAAGAAQAASQASVASQNSNRIKQNHNYNMAVADRDLIVQANAANKEAYQATLEGDRAKSLAMVDGSGMTGATPGLRYAEQSRQSALSIANAKDRMEGAHATYALESAGQVIDTNNALAKQTRNPMTAFMCESACKIDPISWGIGVQF